VRKSIDDAADDHPAGDEERPPASWAVAVADDCEACADVRVVLTVEEMGRAGAGVVAHLSPASARKLRRAIADGLKELGEEAGT
jgi:hypothetical protein